MFASSATGLVKCIFGAAPTPLIVLKPFVLEQGKPAATILDFAPFANIVPFGICSSPIHPVLLATGVTPPCTPVTIPWMPPKLVLNQGVPMIDKNAKTVCVLAGGMIEFKLPGQFSVQLK